ncbi:MAG: hypothetical protein H8E91_01365 [Planctomycetes bacterium]|nr:hypothetical protein [Planctomycetota bacterium]
MNRIIKIANTAARRMQLQETLTSAITILFWIVCTLAVFAIIDRIVSAAFIPWEFLGYVVALGWVISIVLVWRRSRHDRFQSAAEVDQRMNLHDRIGSAITCHLREDPFATVVLDDAISVVEEKEVEKKLRNFFPITFSSQWVWIALLGLIFATVFMTPQWNLFPDGKDDFVPVVVADRVDIEASVDALVEDLQEDETLRDALSQELSALDQAAQLDVSPTDLRREALRKMTDLQKKLDNLLNDENALAYKETVRRLQALELPRNEQTTKLATALKSGNFAKAQQEAENLQKMLESNQLSEEERKQLAESLKKLGEQLTALENANDALSDALGAAGMDPNLSSDALAAENAIKSNAKLSEAQKKKLLEMLEAQKQAANACKKLGKACKKCASGNPSEFASMTKQLEATKMFMSKAEAAKSQCQKAGMGMCDKPGNGNGAGTGGNGKGNGGKNNINETETTTVANRSPVNTIEGSIIARQLFEGGLVTAGETNATVRETVLSGQRSAQEAIAQEEVPRQYHDLLRHYFGKLEKIAESSDENDAVSQD